MWSAFTLTLRLREGLSGSFTTGPAEINRASQILRVTNRKTMEWWSDFVYLNYLFPVFPSLHARSRFLQLCQPEWTGALPYAISEASISPFFMKRPCPPCNRPFANDGKKRSHISAAKIPTRPVARRRASRKDPTLLSNNSKVKIKNCATIF